MSQVAKAIVLITALVIVHTLIALCFALPLHFGHTVTFLPSDPRVGYRSGANDRSTLAIVWTCLSTIIICVYTAVHINVDELSQGRFRSLGYKGLFVLGGIAAPELILGIAAGEYWRAKSTTQKMQAHCDTTSEKPTGRQSDPEGARARRARDSEVDGGKKRLEEQHSSMQRWTMTHSFFLQMGGFKNQDQSVIDTEQFLTFSNNHMRESRTLWSQLDDIREEIQALSKADALVKALACIQITWFLINIIARLASKLPISQLEWTTCGYIGCTFGTYFFWWEKPYNVSRHIKLPIRVPRPESAVMEDPGMKPVFSAVVGAVVFGSCHLAAWNHDFVNSSGKLLWRICASIVAGFPVVFFGFVNPLGRNLSKSPLRTLLETTIFPPCILVYYAARMLLACLLVLSFWSLPAGVYQDTDWGSVLPTIR